MLLHCGWLHRQHCLWIRDGRGEDALVARGVLGKERSVFFTEQVIWLLAEFLLFKLSVFFIVIRWHFLSNKLPQVSDGGGSPGYFSRELEVT